MTGAEFFIRVAGRPPFNRLAPEVAAFFHDYLAHEKVVRFGEQYVVNTHFPPWPGPAFDRFAENFTQLGDAARRLYSVTLAVTNRCEFACWHCYNAGRATDDLPLGTLRALAAELQQRGAVMVTLTGGEPLLREDLEQVVASFDSRSCVIVGSTGDGLTAERARRLRAAGAFGLGVSLDSRDEAEHDRLRGRAGAYRTALAALETARSAGLYAYVVTVATREFLAAGRELDFLRLAGAHGALEVHLLEPSATGRLAGREDVLLKPAERQMILDLQARAAREPDLPILSSYAYLESADAFGCGAGLTHLYIDGSGEVCPCQLVPLSFGNVAREPLDDALARMAAHLRRPRPSCVGRVLAPHAAGRACPLPPDESAAICARHLSRRHAEPEFFRRLRTAAPAAGMNELRAAYDRVHGSYDEFWLCEAGRPIDELIARLPWTGQERVFEAGCGTGYATLPLAARAASVVAVDLSAGMLAEARHRLGARGARVTWVEGDALAELARMTDLDLVFTSWVLGYVPLRPFFDASAAALRPGGQLAFIVHRENSPREPLELFAELVAEDPRVLTRSVSFDFPSGAGQVDERIAAAGLEREALWEGEVVFRYRSAAEVLAHLLKSGAGTAFHDAIVPGDRERLTTEFVRRLAARHGGGPLEVVHEYIGCVAHRAT